MFDDFSENDLHNLHFLLTAPSEVMDEWWETATPDDVLYASTLLEMVRLAMIDRVIDVLGVEEAQQVLQQYTIKT